MGKLFYISNVITLNTHSRKSKKGDSRDKKQSSTTLSIPGGGYSVTIPNCCKGDLQHYRVLSILGGRRQGREERGKDRERGRGR